MTRRILWIAGALVVLLPVIVVLVEHWRGRGQLAATLAGLQTRGEILDIASLAPPPVLAVSNGFTQLWMAHAKLKYDHQLAPPSLVMIRPGTGIPGLRLKRWRGPQDSTLTWDDVATWVDDHAEGFAELQAALDRPVRQPTRDYSKGIMVDLSGLAQIKGAVSILRIAATDAIRRGDYEDAMHHLRGMRQIDLDLAPQPLVIDHLVRVACASIATATGMDILQSGTWTEAQLAALQETVAPTDQLDGAVMALRGERALVYGSLTTGNGLGHELRTSIGSDGPLEIGMPDGLREAIASDEGMLGSIGRGFQKHVIIPLWQTTWGDQALSQYLQAMQSMIDVNESAARSRSSQPIHDFEPEWYQRFQAPGSAVDQMRSFITRSLTPSLQRIALRSLRADTERAMLVTGIALRRFALRQGELPRDLSQLVPDLLPEVPIDHMDGKPLRYRRDADGTFTLWSVGENRVDDGGDPSWPQDRVGTSQWWLGRDAVWPRPATDDEIEAWTQAEFSKPRRARQ